MNVLSEKEKLEIEILQLQKKKLEAELAALTFDNLSAGLKKTVGDVVALYFENGFNSAVQVVDYLEESIKASKSIFPTGQMQADLGLLKANLMYAESVFGEWLACEAYENENGIH